MILKMDAVDDDYQGSRKWQQTTNTDGTISMTDVTDYAAKGTDFGALEYNTLCAAINGFTTSTTAISDDGKTIKETDIYGRRKITVLGTDTDGSSLITETLYDSDGTVMATKETTINGKTITEKVGGQDIDTTALQSEDVDEALATQWNGESSEDTTAMNAEEVSSSLSTQWEGETSEDTEEAISANEIETILN